MENTMNQSTDMLQPRRVLAKWLMSAAAGLLLATASGSPVFAAASFEGDWKFRATGPVAYRGSTAPARRYFLMVLRDRPVRRAISRMDSCSRRAHRLMTLSVATSITPTAPCHLKQ